MITTRIVFDHRGRAKGKNDNGTLEIRVTIDRKSWYISTGVKVTRSQWVFDRVDNRPDADALNERLALLSRAVYNEVNACVSDGRAVDIESLRRKLWTASQPEENVLQWIDGQVEALDVAPGTRKHYITLSRRLKQWGKLQTWSDVTTGRIYEFDAWLHSLRRRASNIEQAQGSAPPLLSDAAVHNYHKCLRYLLSRAERVEKIASNPYNALRGEFKHGEKENTEYLTEEEMAAFMNLHPMAGTKMALARDLFVFQMYTGMAYSDAQAFDIKDYKLIDGKWRSVGERIKTGVPFVNQLLPPAVEVLETYNMKIPRIDLSDYNKALKALGMAAGIKTPLHSHLARHTFATYMLRNGVKIENLSKMLGHANITRTQRYAKVLAQSVHEDFDKIAELLKNQK